MRPRDPLKHHDDVAEAAVAGPTMMRAQCTTFGFAPAAGGQLALAVRDVLAFLLSQCSNLTPIFIGMYRNAPLSPLKRVPGYTIPMVPLHVAPMAPMNLVEQIRALRHRAPFGRCGLHH